MDLDTFITCVNTSPVGGVPAADLDAVSIPLAGAIHIEVEAASAKEAKAAAWDAFNEKSESAGELEWELMDHITTGNVCYAPFNDIEASKCKEAP